MRGHGDDRVRVERPQYSAWSGFPSYTRPAAREFERRNIEVSG